MASSELIKDERRVWRRGSLGRRLIPIAVLGILLAFAVLLQRAGGAYRSEFGGFPDESAHFITALMIRDYVAAGCPTSPIEYAEEYYIHYPKVAFGMWGPLLHFTAAGWMLLVPPSRTAILVLMALITSLTALLLFQTLKREAGVVLAFASAILFLAMPLVQLYTNMVMADSLVGLMDLAAALCFGRFLVTHHWKHSILFGVFACMSILSKGNGVALVLLPLLAILFARQWALLKRPEIWAGAAAIVCIAGPWQIYSSKMLSGILVRQSGIAFLPFYTQLLVTVAGVTFVPALVVGLYCKLIKPMLAGGAEGKWASAAALICAVWLFHCLIPASAPEARYFIAIIPPLLMFTIAGIQEFAKLGPRRVTLQYRSWAWAAVFIGLFGITSFFIPKKFHHGFDEVAELLKKPAHHDGVILVSSEFDGEGMLISEIALRERRPSHFVLRATKMLSRSNWNGLSYELLYRTPDEIMSFLNSVPVEFLVIDNTPGPHPVEHHALLKETIAAVPEQWEHVGSFQGDRPQSKIDVYRLKAAAAGRKSRIRIALPYTLGRTIER